MKALVIVQHAGYVSVENGEGKRSQAPDVERALIAFAHKVGEEWEIKSGFDAATLIERMMGDGPEPSNIHEGVLSA